MLLTEALDQALAEADHHAIDAATVQLARTYTQHLDDNPGDISKVGPRLLDCLEALLLTTQARAKILNGGDDADEEPTNPVDELRQKRERRGETQGVNAP